jgi:DNA-binding MarR family transcriptional regulator
MSTRFRPNAAPRSASNLLREVARLHVRAQRVTLACDGASVTTCTILTELGRAPGMTLAQLSRQLRLDKSWTSRAVDQLVLDGLVERASGEDDRRTVALSLTRAGKAEHRRLEGVLDAQVVRVIERIPLSERAVVAHALELLHSAYAAELAEPDLETVGATCVESNR